jgi:hypothetical protein
VSQDFQLVTRERPEEEAFLAALQDAAGGGGTDDVMLEGDFNDPNGYLKVLGYGLLIEIEPPGHVEAADLSEDGYGEASQAALPEPDTQGCLWLTIARIPAAAPGDSADVAWRVFTSLASRYHGVVLHG